MMQKELGTPYMSLGIIWYMAFLISVIIHEASHAYSAMKLGDNTAFESGQVSIDPFPHIRREPVGTVLIPILSYLMGGWMIGWASTPYDVFWAKNNPSRASLMALSGPLSNLIIVFAVAFMIHIGIALDFFHAPQNISFSRIVVSHKDGAMAGMATFLSILFSMNLLLFTFNLIPLPPLDGSRIIPLFLNRNLALSYMDLIHNNNFSFIGILISWKIFDYIFSPIYLIAVKLLYFVS